MTKSQFSVLWATLLTLQWQKHQQEEKALLEQVYYAELAGLSERLAGELAKRLTNETWLPTLSRLREMLAEIQHGPALDPASVVQEILDNVDRFGRYGIPHPTRPGIRYPGEPPLTMAAHLTVAAQGGWFAVCEGEPGAGLVGLLRKHAQDVLSRLSIAEAKRLHLADSLPPLSALLEEASLRPEALTAREERLFLPAPLDRDKRREVEAELRDKRALQRGGK